MDRKYYDILTVSTTCTQNEIKAAYYKAALLTHPDRNPGIDDSTFKEVTEAYSILINPKKRVKYDQLGKDYKPGKNIYKNSLGDLFYWECEYTDYVDYYVLYDINGKEHYKVNRFDFQQIDVPCLRGEYKPPGIYVTQQRLNKLKLDYLTTFKLTDIDLHNINND